MRRKISERFDVLKLRRVGRMSLSLSLALIFLKFAAIARTKTFWYFFDEIFYRYCILIDNRVAAHPLKDTG